MTSQVQVLNQAAERVFAEVYAHKAMPLFEIAAATGIQGETLRGTVKMLLDQNLVTVTGVDPIRTIVSISGKYF